MFLGNRLAARTSQQRARNRCFFFLGKCRAFQPDDAWRGSRGGLRTKDRLVAQILDTRMLI